MRQDDGLPPEATVRVSGRRKCGNDDGLPRAATVVAREGGNASATELSELQRRWLRRLGTPATLQRDGLPPVGDGPSSGIDGNGSSDDGMLSANDGFELLHRVNATEISFRVRPNRGRMTFSSQVSKARSGERQCPAGMLCPSRRRSPGPPSRRRPLLGTTEEIGDEGP